MAVFTTWTDLLTLARNDLASGQWMSRSYSVDGVSREFRSLDEFIRFISWVEARANMENLSTRPAGRGYVRSAL